MNIVRENINFERGQNPLDSMNIGRVRERRMKKIQKVLEDFADEVKADKNEIYDQSHLMENDDYIKLRIKIGKMYYGIAYSPDSGHYLAGWEGGAAHDVENLETLAECLPQLKKFYGIKGSTGSRFNEALDFERGQEPKKAMRIGVSTWENLKPGDILQATKQIETTSYGKIISKWSQSGEVIWNTYYIQIEEIEQRGNELIIYYYLSDSIEKLFSKQYVNYGLHTIIGTIRQLKNNFNLIQPKDLKESLDFERGKNPIKTMGIGQDYLWDTIEPGDILECKKAFFLNYTHRFSNKKEHITQYSHCTHTPINIGVKLEITDISEDSSRDMRSISLDLFQINYLYLEGHEEENTRPHDNYMRGTMQDFKKHFNVIKKVHESQNFERGQEPKVSMGVGRKPLIIEWIKEMQQYNFITNPVLTSRLTIDAEDVDMSDTLFNQFPPYIKFGEIHNDFKIYIRSSLALKAFPHYVGREVTVYYPSDVEKPCTTEDIRKICEVNGYVIVQHLD